MSNDTDSKISLRLSKEDEETLDQLIDRGEFKNKSEAVRESFRFYNNLMKKEKSGRGIETKIEIPSTISKYIIEKISYGEYVSLEEGLRDLLRIGYKAETKIDVNQKKLDDYKV